MAKIGNVKRLWQTAYLRVRREEPDLERDIEYWEGLSPQSASLERFYRVYCFAVLFTGMKVAVIESLEEEIATALFGFNIDEIADNPEGARENLLTVFGHRQKAAAIIATALRLKERPGEWDLIKAMPASAALDVLLSYKYIGPQNRYHIARNLGWDVGMDSGFTAALAQSLGLTSAELMGSIAEVAGMRMNTTDIIMGMWSRLHDTEGEAIQAAHALLGL